MCGAQDHARRAFRLQRILPPRCAQTPAITGLQSRKAEFRDRRREIIAAGFRILKKSRGHDGAHGVAADVLTAGVAATVAKETGHRAQGTDFEPIAEHVLGLVAPAAAALAGVISQHRGSLHGRPSSDQLHTSTLRPGTFEKCFRLLVTTVIPWETACEAIRRAIFPIGLPERSNSVRIRA